MDNNENLQNYLELQPDTTLSNGKYVIEKKISEGGFGITYKAVQVGLNRTVCIKEYFPSGKCNRNTMMKTVFPQGMTSELYEKYRIAFVNEAKMLAMLRHPNIVEVIDVFDENNTSYMVMEFITGENIQKIVEYEGPMPYDVAINYIGQITNAIDFLHKQHILHRDIKPENIMITSEYKAILIDFGAARAFEHDKIQSHTSMFTRGYAPPEQYHKSSLKGSFTDIYALGATLYFALTGIEPIDSATRTIEKLKEPKELCQNVPDNANRTIMKAMALDPKDRHQTIQEFMDDMLNISPSDDGGEEVSIKPVEPQPKKKKNVFLRVLFVLILLGGIGYLSYWTYMKYDIHSSYMTIGDRFFDNENFEDARHSYNVALSMQEQYPLLYSIGVFRGDAYRSLMKVDEREAFSNDKEKYLKHVIDGVNYERSYMFDKAKKEFYQALEIEKRYKNTRYSSFFDKNVSNKITEVDKNNAEYEKLKKELKAVGATGKSNGHYYVDLGLPSGLKWATCNVGANSPEQYGNYYAWAEINQKSTYTFENSVAIDREVIYDISEITMYDAAKAIWGGDWRLPSSTEFSELQNNCEWELSSLNGVRGYRVIGRNGNSIFIPFAGGYQDDVCYDSGEASYLWSSTPRQDGAICSCMDADNVYNGNIAKYCGLSIRPVVK